MKRFFLACFVFVIGTIATYALGTYYGKLAVAVGYGQGTVAASTSTTAGTYGTTADATNSAFTMSSSTSLTFYAFAQPAEGYVFVGWSTTSGTATPTGSYATTQKGLSVSITASGSKNSPTTTTIYAVFKELPTYYAKATANGNTDMGSVFASFVNGSFTSNTATSSQRATAASDTSVAFNAYFKATTKGSYMFTGWSETEGGAIVSTDNPLVVPVTSSATSADAAPHVQRYANYVLADPYKFSATANTTDATMGTASVTLASNGKTSSTVNGIGSATEKATFVAVANSGYSFVGWGTSAKATSYESTSSTYEVTLNNSTVNSTVSKVLYAFFEEQADPYKPVSCVPGKNATVTESVTQISMTFGSALSDASHSSIKVFPESGYEDWDFISASTGATLSNGNKTVTYTLDTPITDPDTYVVYLATGGFNYLTFADGNKNSEFEYRFTFAENQLAPESSDPEDGVAHEGSLTTYSLTFPQPITNTPAGDALKVYCVSEYDDNPYIETQKYAVFATSSSATLSNGNKTVTYTFNTPFTYYSDDAYVELPYGAVQGADWKSAKVKRSLKTYVNPNVEIWGNGTSVGVNGEVAALDSIALKYPQCVDGSFLISIDRDAFGEVCASNGTAWLQKYKNGVWNNYNIVKINLSINADSRVAHNQNNTALIVPILVDEKGFTTGTINIVSPGRYRVVVPEGSLYTSRLLKSNPSWQYKNQEMAVEFTIPGDETVDYWNPTSTDPLNYGQVSQSFSNFSMTFPLDITTTSPDPSAMTVYDKTGLTKLSTATSAAVSADLKSVTYTLPTPITTKDTLFVRVATAAVGGDQWLSNPVNNRVVVVDRFNVSLVPEADVWRINTLKVDIDRASHDTIYVSPTQKQLPIYRKGKDGAADEFTQKHIAPNADIIYDKANHTRTLKFLENGYLLGEGDYYFDMPTGFMRIATSEEGHYIYSEATRIEFSLAPQPPTQFTVNPADGSTLSSITQVKIDITESLMDSVVVSGRVPQYLLVSKDGAAPIRYQIYNYDRDGGTDDSSSTSEYASSDVFTTSKGVATIKIYEGFKTPIVDEDGTVKDIDTYGWLDTYGYASSGTYTITVPAEMFKIDNSYYNTALTFTYIVKNNVTESKTFEGHIDVLPLQSDTVVDVRTKLNELTLKFRSTEADAVTINTITTATITGATTGKAYMTLGSYEQIDSLTWKLTMNPVDTEEHADDNLIFTFAGTITHDGKTYVYDNMSSNSSANANPVTVTWLYMTQAAYDANTVTFAPVSGTMLETFKTINVNVTSGYVFASNFNWAEIPLYRNGVEMTNYYMKGNAAGNGTTGTLTVYSRETDKAATITEAGIYTVTVPYGYYPLQRTADWSMAYSKKETLTYTIASEGDLNTDGNVQLSDLTILISIINNEKQADDYNTNGITIDVDGVQKVVDAILNRTTE